MIKREIGTDNPLNCSMPLQPTKQPVAISPKCSFGKQDADSHCWKTEIKRGMSSHRDTIGQNPRRLFIGLHRTTFELKMNSNSRWIARWPIFPLDWSLHLLRFCSRPFFAKDVGGSDLDDDEVKCLNNLYHIPFLVPRQTYHETLWASQTSWVWGNILSVDFLHNSMMNFVTTTTGTTDLSLRHRPGYIHRSAHTLALVVCSLVTTGVDLPDVHKGPLPPCHAVFIDLSAMRPYYARRLVGQTTCLSHRGSFASSGWRWLSPICYLLDWGLCACTLTLHTFTGLTSV